MIFLLFDKLISLDTKRGQLAFSAILKRALTWCGVYCLFGTFMFTLSRPDLSQSPHLGYLNIEKYPKGLSTDYRLIRKSQPSNLFSKAFCSNHTYYLETSCCFPNTSYKSVVILFCHVFILIKVVDKSTMFTKQMLSFTANGTRLQAFTNPSTHSHRLKFSTSNICMSTTLNLQVEFNYSRPTASERC